MSEDANLDWLISNYSEHLQKFGIDQNKITAGYNDWKNNDRNNSVIDYLCELLRQASLLNIKNANSEEEFFNSKLQLDTILLELWTKLEKENRNDLLEQIHFDKLMISRLTLPFKFNVQIDSNDCCTYCAKRNKKIVTFEKAIEKKYLPINKCTRVDGCSCSYSIIPLHDENGKLIPKDFW